MFKNENHSLKLFFLLSLQKHSKDKWFLLLGAHIDQRFVSRYKKYV